MYMQRVHLLKAKPTHPLSKGPLHYDHMAQISIPWPLLSGIQKMVSRIFTFNEPSVLQFISSSWKMFEYLCILSGHLESNANVRSKKETTWPGEAQVDTISFSLSQLNSVSNTRSHSSPDSCLFRTAPPSISAKTAPAQGPQWPQWKKFKLK